MYPETKPILFNCTKSAETAEIYPIHDLHYGNECFNERRFNALINIILAAPNRFVIFLGDLLENAIPRGKSDMFTQTCSPHEQKEYITELFRTLKDRTIAITDGNHEINRTTKAAGMYPLYDCACIAGIEDKYRTAYAVMDIAVGQGYKHMPSKSAHYVGFATHKAKALKNFASVDALEGIDFFLYGHDHEPTDHPRGKLVYNPQKKAVTFRSVDVINCGSFLSYGGYGARSGYRPKSEKLYKLILHSVTKQIETVGFYL